MDKENQLSKTRQELEELQEYKVKSYFIKTLLNTMKKVKKK